MSLVLRCVPVCKHLSPIASAHLQNSQNCRFSGFGSALVLRQKVLAQSPRFNVLPHRSRTFAVATTHPGAALDTKPHSNMTAEVPPATLPGTPQNFQIGEEKLISMAKQLFGSSSGQKDPSVLSDDFRFEFPIVSLSKEEYLKATGTFNLEEAFPNLASHPYHWRVDPYETNRVWFTTRVTATHAGPLKFFGKSFKATNKKVLGAPECLSYTFNEQGKCTSFTGGYIMDRRVGNTKKMGALFGILAAIGGPIPEPETIPYAFFILSNRLSAIFKTILGKLTFGILGKKQKKN